MKLIFLAVVLFSSVSFAIEAVPEAPQKKTSTILSPDDQRILERGEMTTTRYVTSGIVGSYFGLGIGQAIQGRYSDKGWIFTAGELGSIFVAVIGFGDCIGDTLSGYHDCNSGLLALGIAGYVGFRIWDVVDLWATPLDEERRYRYLKSKETAFNWRPVLMARENSPMLGLQFGF